MLRGLSNCFNVLFSLAELFFFCRWLFLVCCSYKFCLNIIVKAYLQHLQVHLKILEYNGKRSIFCHSFQKVKPITSLSIELNISSIYFLKLWWTWLTDNEPSSHIKLQPNTSCPRKLNRFEPGQYLDGWPHGNMRVLLEEVLGRPAGSAHPAVCVGHPSIVIYYTRNLFLSLKQIPRMSKHTWPIKQILILSFNCTLPVKYFWSVIFVMVF